MAYWPEGFAGILRELDASDDGIKIELTVRPASQSERHVGILMENASFDGRSRFVLEQYDQLLILTESRGSGRDLALEKTGAINALQPGQLTHISLSADKNETKLYLSGIEVGKIRSIVDAAQLNGPLLLGNSGRTGNPWNGDVLRIAFCANLRDATQAFSDIRVSDKRRGSISALYYDFKEKSGSIAHSESSDGTQGIPLYIPASLPVFNRSLLLWDLRTDRSGISDVLINIVGFIPFGFLGTATLLSRMSLKQSVWCTVVIGFVLSLAVEITQSYLPLRSSSSTDLLMNSLGTLLGAELFASMLARLGKLMYQVSPRPER